MNAVLSWGNKPYDLDMYVIPVDVMGWDKKPVIWSMPFGQVLEATPLLSSLPLNLR